MKKEQQVILDLLKEIDEICRKHKIEYYLSPRLTLCAVEGRPFPRNPQFGVVLMKTADMERFRRIVEESIKDKRELESMKTHKWFPGFYLRYENTDTLCVNLDNARDYAYPGLGVCIYPLRAGGAKNSSMAESGWQQRCSPYSKERGLRGFLSRLTSRLGQITGQQRQAARIYDELCMKYQEPEPREYTLVRKRQTTVYSADIFERSKRVTLEGASFKVPGKIEAYLTASYGPDYRMTKEPGYTPPAQLIVSARISCGRFRQEAGELDAHIKKHMKNNRRLAKNIRMKEYFNQCWSYVEFCGERLRLGVSYEKKKDYIKNLYKNEDYMTLERVFKSYFKMMQKSLQKGELFAEDEEIFDIYLDVLEKTGKTVQRGKIGTMI